MKKDRSESFIVSVSRWEGILKKKQGKANPPARGSRKKIGKIWENTKSYLPARSGPHIGEEEVSRKGGAINRKIGELVSACISVPYNGVRTRRGGNKCQNALKVRGDGKAPSQVHSTRVSYLQEGGGRKKVNWEGRGPTDFGGGGCKNLKSAGEEESTLNKSDKKGPRTLSGGAKKVPFFQKS